MFFPDKVVFRSGMRVVSHEFDALQRRRFFDPSGNLLHVLDRIVDAWDQWYPNDKRNARGTEECQVPEDRGVVMSGVLLVQRGIDGLNVKQH